MTLLDRILTIIVTATLTSALWIVLGSAFFEAAERDAAQGSQTGGPAGAPLPPAR